MPKKNSRTSILPADAVLTASEERQLGRLGTLMDRFHNYFRSEFDEIYDLADGKFEKEGQSLSMFLSNAIQFKRHLEGHHNIEETYLFPQLAKRMDEFKMDEKHRESHKGIHDGIDKLAELIHGWRVEPSTYSPTELRACLDSFREVLFRHLDEEVADLQASNMRKYWSLDEMDQFMV